MDRLASEIAELDTQRRTRQSHVDESTLTEAERAFCVMADSRSKRLLRNGWPDFLMIDPESGGMIGVEVKTYTDEISEAQSRMFAALEQHGLRVMVWSPERPRQLTPWRRWNSTRWRREWKLAPRPPIARRPR
jgi:hypothetical protein